MKRLNRFFIIVLLIFPLQQILADELVLIDNDIYSGNKQVISAVSTDFELIKISASQYVSGELNIKTDKVQTMTMTYKKTIKAPDLETALKFAKLLEVEVITESGEIKLLIKAPNPSPWSGTNNSARIRAELTIPENIALEINAAYFDLTAYGPFAKIDAEPTFGRIKIKNVNQFLDITAKGQRTSLYDISGDISIRSNNADIRIHDLTAGETAARITNDNGSIIIDRANGMLDVRNSYGKIRISELFLSGGNSEISGVNSPIKIELLAMDESSLLIDNTHEDITVSLDPEIETNFDLNVDVGNEIHLEGIEVKPIFISDERLKAKAGNGDNKITIYLEGGGNIEIEGESD